MRKLILLLLTTLVFACSVKDDEVDIPDLTDPPPVYLIKKVYSDGTLLREFEYGIGDQLKSITTHINDSVWWKDTHAYLEDTIIVTNTNQNNVVNNIKKYFKLDDNTKTMRRYYADGTLKDYRLYHFTDDTCGYISLVSYTADDEIGATIHFNFLDENCSVEGEYLDMNGMLTSKDKITRNDQKIKVQNGLADFLDLNNLGSVTQRIVWDASETLINESSYNSSFEYNTDGSPASEFRTFFDSTTQVITWEY